MPRATVSVLVHTPLVTQPTTSSTRPSHLGSVIVMEFYRADQLGRRRAVEAFCRRPSAHRPGAELKMVN